VTKSIPRHERGLSRHPRGDAFPVAISLDDLDTGVAACSDPEVLAGGELHVAVRYGG